MSHLTRDALDRIRVMTLIEVLIGDIKNQNDACSRQYAFHVMMLLKVWAAPNIVMIPAFWPESASAPATGSPPTSCCRVPSSKRVESSRALALA